MAKFPKLPMFEGSNAPSRIEVDIHDLEVEGDIPTDLKGAFYRVAPDPQFPPRFLNDVPFNLDGTVSMFRFQNGRENSIAADMTTQFTAIEDAPNFVVGALKRENAFADEFSYITRCAGVKSLEFRSLAREKCLAFKPPDVR
jgi:carotenoid cleavage dioxygenase-like enzyme